MLQPVQQILKADEGTLRFNVREPEAKDWRSGSQSCFYNEVSGLILQRHMEPGEQPSAGLAVLLTGTYSDKCLRVRDCSALYD